MFEPGYKIHVIGHCEGKSAGHRPHVTVEEFYAVSAGLACEHCVAWLALHPEITETREVRQ